MTAFKKWYSDIGSKSTLEGEQFAYLVWLSALASLVDTEIAPCGDCGIPMHLGIICQNEQCVRNWRGPRG